MNGVNLNGAFLFNYEWRNIKIDGQYELTVHCGKVKQLCFSPDGKTLVSQSNDNNTIRFWNLKTAKTTKIYKLNVKVGSICFSPDGTCLAIMSKFNSISRLWDARTGKLKQKFNGNIQIVSSICFSTAILEQKGSIILHKQSK